MMTRRELTRISAVELRRVTSRLPHELLKVPVVGDIPLSLGNVERQRREERLRGLDPGECERREQERLALVRLMRSHEVRLA